VTGDLPASPAVWERRGAGVMPVARASLAVATQVLVTLVLVTLVLVDAALTVAWWLVWVLMRAHGYAAGRLRPQPGRPARLL
jgi:hypothetical protein